MNFLKRLSYFAGRNMSVIVLLVTALALIAPQAVSFIKTSYTATFLMIIMFGMGLTLHPRDFKLVFLRPKDVFLGVLAQFSIMPFLAYMLTKIFNLPIELALGVILVGTCPGGTSSNVMTYLAKGDVALSVTMTSVSTLLAPIVTPLLTLLLAGESININAMAMFMSITKVVLIPVIGGLAINLLFHRFTTKIVEILPLVSVVSIIAIIVAVVSKNSQLIISSGFLLILVVGIHNLLGYLLGYSVAKALKLSPDKVSAITIEVGMQNTGLAATLASTHFASMPLAAVPGALGAVFHNISGSLLANFLANKKSNKKHHIIKNYNQKEK